MMIDVRVDNKIWVNRKLDMSKVDRIKIAAGERHGRLTGDWTIKKKSWKMKMNYSTVTQRTDDDVGGGRH
ncbi:hypothetical protein Bhyg_01859 [Pseudolycoriella hygida]|uniref:Uncharacterized protein n=1 Tax=Pseudolycoriella hygida TaxID=35572 RepID=A0A9Q0NA84_9DIPT|nr:hypothetical protein Bhyg_01859 [Pseudolycoriella hygida]